MQSDSLVNVLIIGQGGREHALAWKAKQSKRVGEIYVWPGNNFTQSEYKSLDLSKEATGDQLAMECKRRLVGLVIVGPETYLERGFSDDFRRHGIMVFGPNKQAAQLECSKSYTKKILEAAHIPTAKFRLCKSKEETLTKSLDMLRSTGAVVLKASGLASGKGVFVCDKESQIHEAISRLYSTSMQQASTEVVLEEKLTGRECSYFVWISGKDIWTLGFAVDHKRLLPGDQGPNTGGMGCYCPVPWLPSNASDIVDSLVVRPLLKQLSKESLTYEGCLYVGLMWNELGPSVIEFNVRFGDPEAQVLAVADSRDWIGVMLDLLQNKPISTQQSSLKPCLAYTLASSEYPYHEAPDSQIAIDNSLLKPNGLGSVVFHGASSVVEKQTMTGKGRVFTVVESASSFSFARQNAFKRIESVQAVWSGMKWRPDIGEGLQ